MLAEIEQYVADYGIWSSDGEGPNFPEEYIEWLIEEAKRLQGVETEAELRRQDQEYLLKMLSDQLARTDIQIERANKAEAQVAQLLAANADLQALLDKATEKITDLRKALLDTHAEPAASPDSAP